MTQIQEIEKAGNEAIKRLRSSKLKNGHPFMINSNELPTNQCYLEYPDGSIALVTIIKPAMDFTVIHKLNKTEEAALRQKFNLFLS
ncbi:MAG: hypothetical protein V4722_06995 [Bacteroidota bacterium]